MSDGSSPRDAERRAELIAAAIASELSPAEQRELDALRQSDPSVDLEIAELSAVSEVLPAFGSWHHAAPTAELRDRIVAATQTSAPAEPIALGRPRRARPWLLPVAAAACVAIGVGLGALIPRGDSAPIAGPPGTLGAVEAVEFVGEPAGVGVAGDVVAHTWGTETELVIDGLAVGESYSVVVIDRDGREYDSGTFLGSSITVDCQMNAAVLREDVAAVTVRDASGREIATAEVPRVTT